MITWQTLGASPSPVISANSWIKHFAIAMCGLQPEQIYIAEDGLTMARALEIAQAKDTASRDAKNLKGSTTSATVMQLSGSGDSAPPHIGKGSHATGVAGETTTKRTAG